MQFHTYKILENASYSVSKNTDHWLPGDWIEVKEEQEGPEEEHDG